MQEWKTQVMQVKYKINFIPWAMNTLRKHIETYYISHTQIPNKMQRHVALIPSFLFLPYAKKKTFSC